MPIHSLILILYGLLSVTSGLAQSTPVVQIVLSQAQARQGDVVTADVYISEVQNIGGADIGMAVDERCLRVIDLQPGAYLPRSGEAGGFVVVNEVNEHDVRYAAALTDRSKVGVGSGAFYQVSLAVVCQTGVAPLEITFAELSAYQDPAASEIELLAYTLTAGSLTAINAQLQIVVAGDVAPVLQASPTAENIPDVLSTSVPSGSETMPVEQPTNIVLLVVVPLLCLGILGILIAFLILRTARRREDE